MSLLELFVHCILLACCCTLAAAIVVGVKYWYVSRRERRERMAKVEWPQPMHPSLSYDPVPCKGCGHLLPDFAMSDLIFRGSPNITKHNGTYCSVCEIIVRDAVVDQAKYEGIDPNYATARWTDRKEVSDEN